MNEASLKNAIHKSLFLTERMKQELLQYFEKLSVKQKSVIEQGISSEKELLLEFLKHLRTNPNIKLSQIQDSYRKYRKWLRNSEEYKEQLQKSKELENLLEQLDSTYS